MLYYVAPKVQSPDVELSFWTGQKTATRLAKNIKVLI